MCKTNSLKSKNKWSNALNDIKTLLNERVNTTNLLLRLFKRNEGSFHTLAASVPVFAGNTVPVNSQTFGFQLTGTTGNSLRRIPLKTGKVPSHSLSSASRWKGRRVGCARLPLLVSSEIPDLYALARCWIWQKRLLSPLIWPVSSYLSGDLWLQHQFMWCVTASDDPVPLRALRNTFRTHHWSFFIHVLHRFELRTWHCSMAAQLLRFPSFNLESIRSARAAVTRCVARHGRSMWFYFRPPCQGFTQIDSTHTGGPSHMCHDVRAH